MKARLRLDSDFVTGEIDRRIYGSFVEHLGRCVYGGIYEPAHATADALGFRGDVKALVKQLGVPIVRYPGGNFVSGYNWEDGIGERSKRPRRTELAWLATETNEVGIDEFQSWAKDVGSEVMMAVNLGTRGADAARNLLEYCNFPGGTYYSDLRRKNGFEKPFNIKTWCLGNEMDGPWQMCAKTPTEYGRLACETGKLMKLLDPSVELVACGSSSLYMPTFGKWESEVLSHTYDYVDYISLHNYYDNFEGDTARFLAKSRMMDDFIGSVISVCDYVRAVRHDRKKINLSFDEWNIWYHTKESDKKLEKWAVAPPQLEDVFTFEDALMVGLMLITLIRHSDRVKMACIAQLVNVIAPIMTRVGGDAWAQTIFYPFMHASLYGRGVTLASDAVGECYDTKEAEKVPYVETVATWDEAAGSLCVFAVNRSLTEDAVLSIDLGNFDGYQPAGHTFMHNDDVLAVNDEAHPDRVLPEEAALPVRDGRVCEVALKPLSWNVIRFEKRA